MANHQVLEHGSSHEMTKGNQRQSPEDSQASATTLVLLGNAAWRIMLDGRWNSSAFLNYIQEQVQAFSHGVSDCMIKNPK
jgi:hypothetical protein